MKGGVRILSGELRGRRLPVPPSARPTASRVRESLFDVWGDRVRGGRVLELFAGTGAVGFEAVSRGAAEVVMVESDRGALAALRHSREALAPGRTRVVAARVPEQLSRLAGLVGGGFDLIFADPPYEFTRLKTLVEALVPYLSPGGQVVLEHSARSDPGDGGGGLARTSRRAYGDHVLSFFERASEDEVRERP
jgi:16S rRNA (guanine966-N2)-methyltransferase